MPGLLALALLWPGMALAGRSATDLMAEALKLRSAGQLSAASQALEDAVAATNSATQQTLARFMLGDCLLEAGKIPAARDVYQTLLTGDLTDDEQAEACYRLAQCHDRLGQPQEVRRLCRDIGENHPRSPYAQLAALLKKSNESRAATYVSAEEAATARQAATVGPPEESPAAAVPEEPHPEEVSRPAGPSTDDSAETLSGPLPDELPVPDEMADAVGEPVVDQPAAPSPAAEPAPPAPSPADARGQAVRAPLSRPAPPAQVAKPAVARPAPAPRGASPMVPTGAPADLLRFGHPSQAEREVLAGEILKAQEALQRSPDDPDNDSLLFRMASATARFGEYIEACKAYDRLLTQYPSSQYVEKAYFEAIRLRAFLKVYRPVMEWGETFLSTFPRSRQGPAVRRLIEYARRAMTVPSSRPGSSRPIVSSKKGPGKLEDDPRYQEARRRMAAERYSMALRDFESLSRKYPDQAAIWWDLALVQVQQERYGEAENSLNRLLAIDPANQDGRSLLGYVHYQKKDFQKAADVYGQADETASGEGLKFFDPQNAAKRMQKSRSQSAASAVKTQEGEQP